MCIRCRILRMCIVWNAIIELEAELAPQGGDPALLGDQRESSAFPREKFRKSLPREINFSLKVCLCGYILPTIHCFAYSTV